MSDFAHRLEPATVLVGTAASGETVDTGGSHRFTILGPPRTKKNSMRIVGGPRARLIQSRAAMLWADRAVLQLRSSWRRVPIDHSVNLCALVYRDRNVGDLGNFLAAVCDALERAGVVVNDRLIGGFDGSRLLVDRERPRVEITLSPLP